MKGRTRVNIVQTASFEEDAPTNAVTDEDVRRAVQVFNDEDGERGETTLPDDLRAVLEDFASRRAEQASTGRHALNGGTD